MARTTRGLDVLIGDSMDMSAMSSALPWLSMFTGNKDADKAKAEAAARAEKEKKRLEDEAAHARTVMYVTLGLIGTAALGTGVFFLARRK